MTLADTNVLLRGIQRGNLQSRSVARTALKRLYRRGDSVCVSPQNLIELWNVCTRPKAVNGLGMAIKDVQYYLARCELFFRVLPETPEIFPEWKRLVSAYGVSGLKVHDARLVAAMSIHGVKSILTFDVEDFKRYAGITVLHPEDVI